MDRYSLQESLSGADNEETTTGSGHRFHHGHRRHAAAAARLRPGGIMLAVPAASARAPADVQPAVTAEARGSAAPAPHRSPSTSPSSQWAGPATVPPARSTAPTTLCRPPLPRPRPRRSPTVTRALTLSTDSVTSSWRRMLTRVGWRRGSNGRRQHGAGLAVRQRGHPQQTAPIVPVNMDSGTDREQRRLLRVRRELEKIQEMNEEEAVRKEQEKQEQHDLMEFAENYFNDQERCPSE